MSNLRRLWDIEWGTFTFGERIYGKTTKEAADELEELLRGVPLKNARVLDAGCGLGRPAAEFARRHRPRIIVSDISRAALLASREEGLSGFQSDILRIPLQDACCDAAWAHGVLLYVSDPAAAVRELARVTRPGGWIAFTIWPPLPMWLRVASAIARAVAAPLPLPAVRLLAYVLAPLHGIVHRLSRLRKYPVGIAEGAHIFFNLLTAPHLQCADRATVAGWCRDAACEEIEFRTPEVRVLARKSCSGPDSLDIAG